MKRIIALVLVCFLCLAGCAPEGESLARTCQIVLEEGEGYTARSHVVQVPAGEDAVFTLQAAEGYAITGVDREDYTLTAQSDGSLLLRLRQVRYSVTVRVAVEKSGVTLAYHANGGGRTDGGSPDEILTLPMTASHLRLNTATGQGVFFRESCTLTGWNTAADGSGTTVGLGSRVEPSEGLVLYAQWSPWSSQELFAWESSGDGVKITAYLGTEDTVTVPGELDGQPVRSIGAGAFENVQCRRVILPDTLWTVENGAFSGCFLEELVLFDNIRTISDHAFKDCDHLRILRLNAVEAPVYCGTYYATFADKFDRLQSLRDTQKIVLFSGSSTRFGYDSAMLDEAFPDYEVVNMGVFAYTNAMPQFEIILNCMGAGDILLHSPELDAAQRQFCTTTDLDAAFFNMMESNYDAIALLDLRNYTKVFESLSQYLASREGMEAKSYSLSPADFDEDGNPVDTPSYNDYGDYILYRPNAATAEPVYGLGVPYTVAAYPKAIYIDPLNAMLRQFLDKGVRVYITYSPRNILALSEESTEEARRALDAYLRENLCVPVISEMEDSLWSGVYLYGTDNHLSTEGVTLRTTQVIADLKAQIENEEMP